jgi:asparagine synthase (glutamine-hydrolysing)
MCGIVGVLQHTPTKFNQQHYIQWCLQNMHHRGPDSNGVFHTNEYHTGFVRLAIRDLSPLGNQPMHSACNNYVLSFNGEIYNSNTFIPFLKSKGVVLQSTSDTEVLLYALIHYPIQEILPQLNGMFAFAFYNKQTKQLIVARDRVGIKPLYIGYSNNGFIYSSQYNHIVNHPYCSSNNFNIAAITSYLQLGFMASKLGIVEHTQLLPQGHYVIVQAGNVSINIQPFYNYTSTKKQNADTNLAQVVQQAVEQQMISDVPLGTFMSGGTDSTLVTHYASNALPQVQSFTIGTTNKEMDETHAAQSFANIFKTNHTTKVISETDVLQLIQDNAKAYSEPFADYSSLPTLLLSKITREKVTVALSGDGGDELFWGYPRNQKIIKASEAFKYHLLIRNFLFLKEKIAKTSKRNVVKRHLATSNYLEYYYRSLFIHGAEKWVPKLVNVEAGIPYFFENQMVEENDILNDEIVMQKTRKLEVDIHLQRILIKVDRASMWHSLEVRVPLLDNDVLDYSEQQSFNTCIQNNQGKFPLKQLLFSLTKSQYVYAPKKGFTVPLATWIKEELYTEISNTILHLPKPLAVFFNDKAIRQMLFNHVNNIEDNAWIIWALYSLATWYKHHYNIYTPLEA